MSLNASQFDSFTSGPATEAVTVVAAVSTCHFLIIHCETDGNVSAACCCDLLKTLQKNQQTPSLRRHADLEGHTVETIDLPALIILRLNKSNVIYRHYLQFDRAERKY